MCEHLSSWRLIVRDPCDCLAATKSRVSLTKHKPWFGDVGRRIKIIGRLPWLKAGLKMQNEGSQELSGIGKNY
jgi:hypothetical protein